MKSKNAAFTLIELLLTLSIAWILLGVALPSFDDMLERKKVSANVQRLVKTLQLSRLTAINDNVKVTVCPIENGLECTRNWSTGYMAFIDHNGDRQFNNDDSVLYQFLSEDEEATLKLRAFGHRNSLQWLATGITNHQNGSFELCYGSEEDKSRALFLTKAGRIRFSKDTNGDNIHENSNGGRIRC